MTQTTPQTAAWLSELPASFGLTDWLLAAVLGLALVAWVLGRTGRACRLGPDRPTLQGLIQGEDGLVALEFTLAAPIALTVTLVLVQMTLLMGAIHVVQYAAFTAARSTIVQLWRHDPMGAGPQNTIAVPEEPDYAASSQSVFRNLAEVELAETRYLMARRAAVFALVPISERLTEPAGQGEAYAEAVGELYQGVGEAVPGWSQANGGRDALIAGHLRYADRNTRLRLGRPGEQDPNALLPLPDPQASLGGDAEDVDVEEATRFSAGAVTAEVSFRYPLVVPYAGRIFVDSEEPDPELEGLYVPDERPASEGGRWPYATISARCTLSNQRLLDTLAGTHTWQGEELDRVSPGSP